MSRPAIAHIRLDAFRHNYRIAKQIHGGKSLAVVKANGYGHGAVQCAFAIQSEADGFAVACIEEAIILRQAGITSPILLLEGFFEASELPEIIQNQLWIVVHHRWQAEILMASKLRQGVHVWLKLDSGMHRIGLRPEEFSEIVNKLDANVNIASITIMTHFANADQLNVSHTNEQLQVLQSLYNQIKSLSKIRGLSLANSAAILGWPSTISDWSRPGIMLYGANPVLNHATLKDNLRPVMQLTSRIISTRHIPKGDAIGYGSLFTAKRNSLIGVVACGYADGYPRLASSSSPFHNEITPITPVAVDGHLTQIVGRVSMDMLFVDLTDLPMASIGSKVELWGDQIPANQVANAAGTIAYELFCNVKRVEFQYTDSQIIN